MNLTKYINSFVFGKHKELTLDRKILILVTFYTIIIAVAGNIVNILLEFDIKLIVVTSFSLILVILFFLFARNSKYYYILAVPLFILSILILSVIWILSAGYNGNTVNLMFVYFIGIYIIIPTKLRTVVFFSYLVTFIFLFLFQHYKPEFVVPYDNNDQRFADLLYGNILYLFFAFFMIDIIISNYSKENQKVQAVNDELIMKNKEIEENNRKIRESEDRFRAMAEQIPDVLYLTDREGRLTYLSPANTHITGWKSEEIIGHLFTDYITESEHLNTVTQFQNLIMHNQVVKDFPVKIIRKDNTLRDAEVQCSPFYLQDKLTGTIGLLRDVTDKKFIEEKIIKLSKGIEQSPASVFITDLNGTIEYANPRFTEITGYSAEEAIGKNPKILKSGFQDQEFYKNLWDTILSGEPWKGEICNKKKNGELFWESASIFPIKNEVGEIRHFIAVKEDITHRKKLQEELIIAKEKAEESDRLKSAFLANMSHEIRTPLNGILGFTSLLKRENLSKEQKENYIKIIKKSADGLMQIINDILDISKIESGQLDIINKSFDINSLVSELYSLYLIKIADSGTSVKLNKIIYPRNVVLVADELRLKQIFINLLDNALKFTKKGMIEFGIQSLHKNKIVLFVRDTGIGIPKNMQKLIFDRFRQAKHEDAIYRGNGLGLSIVKQLLGLMGGDIILESQTDIGSTFTITLPYDSTVELINAADVKTEKIRHSSELKILLVDDDPASLKYLEEIMKMFGYSYETATTGREVMRYLNAQKQFDIILLDIQLPDTNGFEFVEQIRNKTMDVKIIAQTAYAMQTDEIRTLESGCDDYISKPVDADLLKEKIESLSKK